MKARAAHAPYRVACLCVFAVLAFTGGSPSARAQSAAPAAAAAAPAYEDRLIGGGTLTPDISSGDYQSSADSSGLARSIRIDAVTSTLSQQGANAAPTLHENGIVVDTQWETSTLGAWSADGAVRIGGDDERLSGGNDNTSFTLHQRGMPFDGGWQADNALGDLNAPLINLERMQQRFVLSSGTMLGAETEWRGPAGLQIVAGGGEPGLYGGIKVPTFDTLGGSTETLGAQWSPAAHWTIGGEYAGAHNANIYYQPPDSTLLPPDVANQRISSDTGILSAAWQDAGTRAQVNLIDGTLDGNGSALGVWADASRTRGAFTQTFGAFHIEPNLAWGNQLITSDVEGGYYRLGYQSRRWTSDLGIDQVWSVSGKGSNSTFLNGDTRYQLSRDLGIGGVANVLLTSDGSHNTAWSLEGYVDDVNRYGTGRVQLDYATDSQTQDSTVTLQQTWALKPGLRLSTSLAVDRVTGDAVPGQPRPDSTIVRLAASGGGDLTARLSLDGTRAVGGCRAGPGRADDLRRHHAELSDRALLGVAAELLREPRRLLDSAGGEFTADSAGADPAGLPGPARRLPHAALPGSARRAFRAARRRRGVRFRAPERRHLPGRQRERTFRCRRERRAERHRDPRRALLGAHRFERALRLRRRGFRASRAHGAAG